MALRDDDLQTIVNAVLSAIRTNSLLIDQLPPVSQIGDLDNLEISGGRRVQFKDVRDAILSVWSESQIPLPVKLRFRGPFDPNEMYFAGDTYDATKEEYEHSLVEYFGCLWACNKTATHTAPSWTGTDWTFYLGDPTFRVSLDGGPVAVNPRRFRFTLTLKGEKGGQDVTANILPQDVVWTRHSTDTNGIERTASDTIWALTRGGSGKSIELTEADLDAGLGVPETCVFRATVTLRDGTEQTAEYGLK